MRIAAFQWSSCKGGLVTGRAGYVGSLIVLELLGASNYNVGSELKLVDVAHNPAACESSR